MKNTTFDIVFIGHIYRDRICHFGHDPLITMGGALSYGAFTSARVGKKTAVITKMNPEDSHFLDSLEKAGVTCFVIPTNETSEFEVIYPTEDTEHRIIYQRKQAGTFLIDEIPEFNAPIVHLAGNAYGEFTLDFMKAIASGDRHVGVDMQAFVRQVNPSTQEVAFKDVAEKKEIASIVTMLKLDALEARILTGHTDPDLALGEIESWGCPEIIMTRPDCVYGRLHQKTHREKFTNKGTAGRNGRGDTTFAGYLSRRQTHSPEESLKFAAAVASIKLEKLGPFNATLQNVLDRMDMVAAPIATPVLS